MSEKISWFRYVPHARVKAYQALGWIHAAYLGPTHGAYSILMQWGGDGEPREPELGFVKIEVDAPIDNLNCSSEAGA